jgi:hypothetical protein
MQLCRLVVTILLVLDVDLVVTTILSLSTSYPMPCLAARGSDCATSACGLDLASLSQEHGELA